MKERIRSLLRWLDTCIVRDGNTFPVFLSTDGCVSAEAGFEQLNYVCRDLLARVPALQTFHENRIRVSVLLGTRDEQCEECGADTYYLIAEFLDPEGEQWRPLLLLHETNLDSIRNVLNDTDKFLTELDRQV